VFHEMKGEGVRCKKGRIKNDKKSAVYRNCNRIDDSFALQGLCNECILVCI
jgi:hypothetical protein